jgi:predicted nucleic acid-binding Zn ribbon protein
MRINILPKLNEFFMSENLSHNPKRVDSLIEEVLRRLGLENEYYESIIREKWTEIAGTTCARACKSLSFYNGRLIIEVENSTWRTELRLRKDTIKAQLNKIIGKNIIFELILK